MIEALLGAVGIAVSGGAAVFGYIKSRDFVARRLRYVDSVRKPITPWAAGAVATAVAAPVVWLLPIIGGPAALLFGAAVGVGTRAGVKRLERPALDD
jgi:hypothetical protein